MDKKYYLSPKMVLINEKHLNLIMLYLENVIAFIGAKFQNPCNCMSSKKFFIVLKNFYISFYFKYILSKNLLF